MDNLGKLFSCLSVTSTPITVVYTRVSSDAQASLSDQIVAAEEYVRRKRLPKIERVFTDIGSGTDVSRLAHHSQMMDAVLTGPGSHLVVYDVSRIGRSVEVFKVIEALLAQNISIHSVHDGIVASLKSPSSLARLYSLVGTAIEFSQTLSKKIKTSLALKKKRGVFLGRKVPYGFKIKRVKKINVTERYLIRDPESFANAMKLSKTVRSTVKRPEGMKRGELIKLRHNFKMYVRMAKIGEAQ